MPYYFLVEGQESDNDNDNDIKKCNGTLSASYTDNPGENCQVVYDKKKSDDKNADEWCESMMGCSLDPVQEIKFSDNGSATTVKKNLSEILTKLTPYMSGSFTKTSMEFLEGLDKQKSELLYKQTDSPYIIKIKKLSLLELGNPVNSNELDFIENVIINFIDLTNSEIGLLFADYCGGEDLNIDLLLTLAIFYNNNLNDFSNVEDAILIKTTNILNRLSRYLPDVFLKILTGMKMCPNNSTKYMVLENVFRTMFKFNNTSVNLDLFSGFKSVMDYLKKLQTIEMVIAIIAIAFVLSKVFDMFKVNVAI